MYNCTDASKYAKEEEFMESLEPNYFLECSKEDCLNRDEKTGICRTQGQRDENPKDLTEKL